MQVTISVMGGEYWGDRKGKSVTRSAATLEYYLNIQFTVKIMSLEDICLAQSNEHVTLDLRS